MKLAQLSNPKYFPHVTTGACKGVRGFLIFRTAKQAYTQRVCTLVIPCFMTVISSAIVPVFKRSIRPSPLSPARTVFHFLFLFVILFCSPRVQADSGEDATRALARKVASTPSRDARLFLVWENHSVLSEETSLKLRDAFVSELGGSLTTSATSNAPVLRVTLEETPSQIVLTARVPAGQEEQIHLVAFYKSTQSANSSTGTKIRMQKELVWEQIGQILDAAEFTDQTSKEKVLLLLNKDRVALYKGGDNQWELSDSKVLPGPEKPTRDARGEIRFSQNNSTQIMLPSKICDVNLSDKIEMHCKDRAEKFREATILTTPCSDSTFLLRSDARDGSIPDRIFLRNPASNKTDSAIAELEFPGSVRSIFPGEDSQRAGAVVFNLSSGVYEVYRVSAVCGN